MLDVCLLQSAFTRSLYKERKSYSDLDTVIREDEGGVGGSELGGGHFDFVVEGVRMRCQYARVVEVC